MCKLVQDFSEHHVSHIKENLPDEDISQIKKKIYIIDKSIHDQAERIKNLVADIKMWELLVIEQE